jgi:hypothetical protein
MPALLTRRKTFVAELTEMLMGMSSTLSYLHPADLHPAQWPHFDPMHQSKHKQRSAFGI